MAVKYIVLRSRWVLAAIVPIAMVESLLNVMPVAICEQQVLALLPRFCGVISQRPPAHSAIQLNGQRAYNLARQGIEFEIPSREVTVYSFNLLRFQAGPRARILTDICCSKGTYIRSLARDLGEALGVGGTLTFLARTRINDCRIEDSVYAGGIKRNRWVELCFEVA